jgi:hypothetical protein
MKKEKKDNKPEEKIWPQRRREYHFGIMNPELYYSSTTKGFLHIVCEKTLGFSKSSDGIALSQFQGVMKLSERRIEKIRERAVACNLITTKQGVGKGNFSRYSPQEDQTKWKPDYETREGKAGLRKQSHLRQKMKPRLLKDEVSNEQKVKSRYQKVKSRSLKGEVSSSKDEVEECKPGLTVFTAHTAITGAKTKDLNLKEFLIYLKQNKESSPNLIKLATGWDSLFKKETGKSYSFKFEEDLKFIKDSLTKDPFKDHQKKIEIYFQVTKDSGSDYIIEDFSFWSLDDLEMMKRTLEKKANQYKLSEKEEKELSQIRESEDKKGEKEKAKHKKFKKSSKEEEDIWGKEDEEEEDSEPGDEEGE